MNKWYYLYPFVLWYPPLHELFHCLFAVLFGARVTELHFTVMSYTYNPAIVNYQLLNSVQDAWQFSTWIPFITFNIFICKLLYECGWRLRWKVPKEDAHIE